MGTFDTALMEALLSIGIPPERARAVVDSFDRSIDARYSLHAQVLATKLDLAEMEARLLREMAESRERIAAIEVRLGESNATLNSRINETYAALSARIAETKSETLRWTLGALTAQTALLLSAMKLL
jgi:predicted P-loop ATPase